MHIEFPNCAFWIQFTPVFSAVVSGVLLVLTIKEISKYLPCCDAYSRPHFYIISTKLWVECYKSENIFIFYKDKLDPPPSESGVDQDTFILCIQAPFQMEAFWHLGNGFIGIDTTHNTTQYKEMLLFTIMARDN